METKSYTISFFGLDPQYYTNAIIGDIWNMEAIGVYQKTGISITGEVHDRYFVNPESEELSGSNIFLIESKKFPDEDVTDQAYWNAYREVAEKVRGRLGNPGMNLTEETINITYFEKI